MNQRVREIRKSPSINLTLEKFGERLGVGKNAISRIETGKSKLTEQMFKSICREFNVNPEWLRDGTGDMFVEPDVDTAYLVSELLENGDDEFYQAVLELIRTYERLSPDGKKALCDFGHEYIENLKTRKK